MGLFLKNVTRVDRSLYLYYPEIQRHNPYIVRLLTVLRPDASEASVQKLLDDGLKELAEEKHFVLAFPNPLECGWNAELAEEGPDDLTAIDVLLSEVTKEDDLPIKCSWSKIPETSEMLRQWHIMDFMRYMVGVEGAADMAYAYAACRPENLAVVCGFGGTISDKALAMAKHVPVTAALTCADEKVVNYFISACGCTEKDENERRTIFKNPHNPAAYVVTGKKMPTSYGHVLSRVEKETFSQVRRMNTGKAGDLTRYTDLTGDEFIWYLHDDCLGDMEHTWLVHMPQSVKEAAENGEKVPVVFFFHGGSDNPSEAAEMSKFHELGRKEKFITVYPWGSNTANWNIDYTTIPGGSEYNDEQFGVLLIDYMIKHYPIDPQRVYMSGFSNGAAMAQVIAMLYPEKVAALIHIDSNWPGYRWAPMEIDINEIAPMRRALAQKKDWMRMPVWYTYGTREASCPVYKTSTQQYQYDFWKKFNNITIEETPAPGTPDAYESGVRGAVVETIRPSQVHPEQYYVVNRFFTNDPTPENYYNYVMMHDKGHDVAPMDPVLAWNYAKQFKRNPDGTVGKV